METKESKKILIIGGKETGKTKLIKDEIIPKLDKFTIFDIHQEYIEFKNNTKVIHHTYIDLKINVIKECVINDLKDGSDESDNTYILEDMSKIFDDFSKLKEAVKNKNIIMTVQSIQCLVNKKVPNFFNEIYLFSTLDNTDIRSEFLKEHMEKGSKINILTNN